MHTHHASGTFTLSERRLCHLMPPGPEGAEQLQALVQHERSRDVMNDPTKRAEINVAERAGAAAAAVDVARGHINHVVVHEYQHLTAAPGATPPGRGMTPENAIREINAMLTRAGIRLFRAEADPTATPPIKTINAPAGAPPAGPADLTRLPARFRGSPAIMAVIERGGFTPAQQNAIIDVLVATDTPQAQAQFEAWVNGLAALNPAQRNAVMTYIVTGRFPDSLPAADRPALAALVAMATDPNNVMSRIVAVLGRVATAPDSPDAPEKAKSILTAARTAYKEAKRKYEADRTPKNEAEMIYIRDTAMGRLMLMGIDVGDEEGMLLRDPAPEPKMLETTEKWQMMIHKAMGALRMVTAIMNKVKGKLPEAAAGPAAGAPENTPERLKTAGIDKLKAKGPLIAKVPPGTPIDNADPNNTVYKFTKGTVTREYRFNGTEWQVKKGPTDADWTKNTADAGVLIVGAGTPPAALTPDQTEANALTRDMLTVPAAPGAAPAAAPADDATKERLKTESDAKYGEVIADVTRDHKTLARAKVDAAVTALEAENRVSNLDAGRKATVERNLKEVKTFIKCLEVLPKYEANKTNYENYKNALNAMPHDVTAIQNAALAAINGNTEELAVLNSATDWFDTPNTTKFIGGAMRANRVAALTAALRPDADYAQDQANPNRRFEAKAQANRAERLNQVTALMANAGTLGVGGITTVRQQNETHWKIDLEGYWGSANWMHVGYDRNTASFTVGLTSSENDGVPWNADLATDYTNASISNDDGRRQANEIQAKLRDIQNRLPIDPAQVRLNLP